MQPLPPTLAEPPTAAPPVQGGEDPVPTTTPSPPAYEEDPSLQQGEEDTASDVAASTGMCSVCSQ